VLAPLALLLVLLASPATFAASAASAASAESPAGPWLIVAAPPALAGVAARVRAVPPGAFAAETRLMGLADPGPPIRVQLVPEGSPAARSVPRWIAGYALGAAAQVVLFPARAPSYPDSSLDDLLRHEVAHVLAARAAGGRHLPRWFDEGLAMIAGNDASRGGIDDGARLTLAMLLDRDLPLAGLDSRFAGSERQVAAAYAVSGAFVRDLVQRHGAQAPGIILAAVREGDDFPAAYLAATGTPLAAAEAAFRDRHSLQRWLPLVTSSTVLWLGITALALYAMALRRRRDEARRVAWDEEEGARQNLVSGASNESDPQLPFSDT
jgi:hypothetical protein